MNILNLFEAVYISHVISLLKKGLECLYKGVTAAGRLHTQGVTGKGTTRIAYSGVTDIADAHAHSGSQFGDNMGSVQ